MDHYTVRPRVFLSRCLGFAPCRWNGVTIHDTFIEALKPHVECITVCPEIELGLGVPRDPISIVFKDNHYKLMQHNTGNDLTESMLQFTNDYLDVLQEVDGFILKDRSPSCGIKDVKVSPGLDAPDPLRKTSGFFAREIMKRFGAFAIESEKGLQNVRIREHFLAKLFVLSRFRQLRSKTTMKDLVQFHTQNKLLFMAYNQKELAIMGRIVANTEKRNVDEVFIKYEEHFLRSLNRLPQFTSHINVLMHAFGYFSKNLSSKEKRLFLNALETYKHKQIPLSVPISLLRSYITRFQIEYLAHQTYLEPYPIEVGSIGDSQKVSTY